MNYGIELGEKTPVILSDQKSNSGHTFMDREQFLRSHFASLPKKSTFYNDINQVSSRYLSVNCRLARQVLHLESAMSGISVKIELILKKIGIEDITELNKINGKSVTNHIVSISLLCRQY